MRGAWIAAVLCYVTGFGAQGAIVPTAEGPVEGLRQNSVEQFLGVPFAAPPVGPLRWMPPQESAKWTQVRQAKSFGPPCAQVTTLGPFAGPANSNEDCLYLNVFTPDVKTKLPVLVWIHGGGYFDGASNDYDGSKLAAQGKLVVVTINYRLNLFGFLAHPALDGKGKPFGNYGLMDMQAALKWVRANIASFGGDPKNVTLGGQSAGAGAAAAHVISPGAAGLFHRAIFQSGGYSPLAPLASARERGVKFAAAAGCQKSERTGDSKAIAQCLRALPAARIAALSGTQSATSAFVGGAMIDGKIIPRQAIDAFRSGNFNRMPIMMGTTRDEGNFTVGIAQYFKKDRAAITEKEFGDYVQRVYGGNAGPGGTPPAYPADTVAALKSRYPVTKTVPHKAWAAVHSDMLACRGQYVAGALARHAPLYMYRFDDPTAPSYFPKMAGFEPGAYHTGDIPYVFIGYHGGPDGVRVPLTPSQTKLSDKMIAAWANFARTGNPNGKGDAPWPRWQEGGPAYFLQDNDWKNTLTNAQFTAAHQCGFWQSILLYK